jgi:hypothetical protein
MAGACSAAITGHRSGAESVRNDDRLVTTTAL